MIVLIVIAAILVIMGVVILIGKGDNLIAGYNTASEEERAQYNVKRLRGLIGGRQVLWYVVFVILYALSMVLLAKAVKDIDRIASEANSRRASMTGPSGVTVNYTTMDQLLSRLSNFSTAVK